MEQKRILIVDNEEDQLKIMKTILVKLGYEIISAISAEEAEVLFQNQNFDLVITDLIMPEMDGIELCEKLKKTSPNTPVYGFSGHIELYEDKKLERAGFDGFINKPISIDELGHQIQLIFKQV